MNSSSDSSIHDFNHWLFIRTTGDIWIGDRQLSQLKPKQLQQMRSQVGMVFQKFHLVGSLSAFHNVLHGALGRSNSPRYWFPATAPENERIKAMECLERVNLVHVAQQRVDGVYSFSRGFITLLRVILDLVWGLLFIVVVGLGVGAGILAITVDVMGFCGKFFAERIEEIDPKPVEALRALGASEWGIIVGAIFPATMPSFVASTLYSLEASVRSAVVLGLVGAGGIGVELATSMQLLRYDEALMTIIVIFVVVLLVEQVSAVVRKALMWLLLNTSRLSIKRS